MIRELRNIYRLNKSVWFLVLIIFCGACSSRPKEIIGEKKLVKIMADMQLAEAYMNLAENRSADSNDRLKLGRAVLASHGVTQEQLDTTLSWYGRNLDDYSELYAKVDKEIISRRTKLEKMSGDNPVVLEDDMLWAYGKNGLLSDLGIADSWILSVPEPEINKGDRLKWRMHLAVPVQMTGVLGVEYADGSSESTSQVFTGKNNVELICQTDTSKEVKRIYGTMRLKDDKTMPVFVDSISLTRLDFDTLEYYSHRNSRRYGIPVRKMVEKKNETDSVSEPEFKEDLNTAPENVHTNTEAGNNKGSEATKPRKAPELKKPGVRNPPPPPGDKINTLAPTPSKSTPGTPVKKKE